MYVHIKKTCSNPFCNDPCFILVDKGFYEEAASLAEKYYEFVALIAICNTTNDKERLEHYMDKFSEHNFAEFVFAWHIKEGKQGRLLAESAKNSQRQTELGRFLHGYSDISWMHDIQTKKYGTAAETLKGLAENESDYCARKKVFRLVLSRTWTQITELQ